MERYKYRPLRFYVTCFAVTWTFWILAAKLSKSPDDNGISSLFMLLGLAAPAVIAVITVLTSGSRALKADLKRKIVGFYRIRPLSILAAVVGFVAIVLLSILLSLLAGQSLEQLAFTEDFSFSIGGVSALLTILLAAVIEEIGWRGYGEDSVASYFSWFTESVIFGFVWALWHLPLFWIEGTYHYGLRELGIGYVLNFLVSVSPLGFLTTWVYVKNNRSMLACILFHLFVNTMQEKIAMTPQTKCVETIVVFFAAAVVVLTNREMFFEKDHIGNLLDYKEERKIKE
ncbi:MAG: CPBP family intramembrane metalloprotease [Roseburia sp.]|nr:CPBP family intramembrane metalloprotease [Roseburia sp.]MCM1099425.1 CPBP family intramembrane metalloprotease [Ruminococcus flavefaciens]